MRELVLDLLLPETDRAVLIQVVVVLPLLAALVWASRRDRDHRSGLGLGAGGGRKRRALGTGQLEGLREHEVPEEPHHHHGQADAPADQRKARNHVKTPVETGPYQDRATDTSVDTPGSAIVTP